MMKVRKTEVKQTVTRNRKLYRVDGNSFKHKETTKDIVIRLFNSHGGVIQPDQTHKWSAQVASLDSKGIKHYQGQYPVKFNGIDILVDSEDLTDLAPGDYELEIWETYTDDKPETTVYPSPGTTIPFHIDPTVPDSESEQIKQLDIQDVINLAVIKAGQNLVIDKINTLPTGSQASVKQEYKDGKNVVTLNIPAGPQGPKGDKGDKGQPGGTPVFASGITTTLNEDQNAFLKVIKINDNHDGYRLDAGIPRGRTGDTGPRGPQGEPGPVGKPVKITVDQPALLPAGSVPTAEVKNVSDDTVQLHLGIPAGAKGETGGVNQVVDASISMGTITTLNSGDKATASLVKTGNASYTLNIGIPAGIQGPQGERGVPGPKGDKGERGMIGDTGPQGPAGPTGANGATPQIDKSNLHWIIDGKDSGIVAQGKDGKDGQPGKDGVTPHLNMALVETLEPGTNATATLTQSGNEYTFHLAIPRGAAGEQGPRGPIGPTGANGKDGQPGKDGVSPKLSSVNITQVEPNVNASGSFVSSGENLYGLNLSIPKPDLSKIKIPNLKIGKVATADKGNLTITSDDQKNNVLNIDFPKGVEVTSSDWTTTGATFLNGASAQDSFKYRVSAIGNLHIVQVVGWISYTYLPAYSFQASVQLPLQGYEGADYYFSGGLTFNNNNESILLNSYSPNRIELYVAQNSSSHSVPINSLFIY